MLYNIYIYIYIILQKKTMYFTFKKRDLLRKSNVPPPVSALYTSHAPGTAHFVPTHLCAFSYAVPSA